MASLLFVSYTAEMTGPSNSLMLLLQGLRPSFHVSVVVPGDGPLATRLRDMGVQVHDVGPLTKRNLLSLMGLVRRESPDLVYANNTHGSSRLAYIAARAAGSQFVVHVRGMLWDKGWRRLWYLNRAEAVVAVSEATARSVSRFVKADRLHVVYNGVPMAEAGSSASEIRRGNGSGSGALTVLSLAHVCVRKGQLDAVRALASARDRGCSLDLDLAGSLDREPDYVKRVEAAIASLELGAHVNLLGYRTDVRELLEAADIYLHTAHADPHPRSVIEAMASGLPVVAYGVDGVAETVVDGETGYLVPPGDADALGQRLGELAGDPALRSSLGAAGAERARDRFTADATTEGVRDIIQGILDRRAGGATR
jgi:glycosyltransferase involved in cell wall biosynthesis